jgi:hypothetical protein
MSHLVSSPGAAGSFVNKIELGGYEVGKLLHRGRSRHVLLLARKSPRMFRAPLRYALSVSHCPFAYRWSPSASAVHLKFETSKTRPTHFVTYPHSQNRVGQKKSIHADPLMCIQNIRPSPGCLTQGKARTAGKAEGGCAGHVE